MSSNVALRYYLPKTVFDVAASVRYVVVYDKIGGHLEPRADIAVVPKVVPDRAARCRTTLDAGVLNSASFGVQLTAEGLIDAVGTHLVCHGGSGGAGALAGWVSTGARPRGQETEAAENAELAHRATWTRLGALRDAFNHTHPRTAALIADLSARAEQFLAGMRMGDGPAEVEVFGSGLAVVERELAAADRMRREWIAAQGFDVRSGQFQVDLADAVAVSEPLPERLPGDTDVVPGPAQLLARDYGLLIAAADPVPDPDRAGTGPGGSAVGDQGYERVDEVLLRRARPVTVTAYRRAPAAVGGPGPAMNADDDWVRDDALTQHLEAVDAGSAVDIIGPQSHLGGDQVLNMSFYPSGSVRTFGVSSAVPAGTVATSLGGKAAAPAETSLPSRSDVVAAALEAARLQLALLQASDEFARLAATHAYGGELAILEQDARFAALRSLRG